MDIDWERELDRAITPGADRPTVDFLVPGRRALRRRRTMVSAASAAAVAVVVGFGATLGATAGLVGEGPTGTGVAVDPSQDPAPDRTVNRVEEGPSRDASEVRMTCGLLQAEPHPARYDGSGRLCLAEGAEVLERVPDPLDYGAQGKSVGLHLAVDGGEQFVLATWAPDGRTQTSADAAGTLADWLPAQVAAQRERDDEAVAGAIGVTEADEVIVDADVTVVELQEVDLGPGFAPDGVTTYAAELEVEGVRELLLLDTGDTTEVVPDSDQFATFEDFVADAEQRYPEDGGPS